MATYSPASTSDVTTEITPGVGQYLRDHRTGVLATQKKIGAPQLTLIAYHFDERSSSSAVVALVASVA